MCCGASVTLLQLLLRRHAGSTASFPSSSSSSSAAAATATATMPKLYYSPTSCGAASFIVAHTARLALPCETVDLGTHKTASGKVRARARCLRARARVEAHSVVRRNKPSAQA